MKQLGLSSAIHKFSTCKEFAEAFELKETDLIITCKYIFEPYFGDMDISSQVIYQEEFGSGEPTDDMVNAMIKAVKTGYKRIIGIGGGTVLDISKLFALETITPLVDLFQGRITPQKKCELVLVPTTCGTGSEVTNVSILGFNSLNTKLRLAVDEIYADDAVLIPQLIEKLPRQFFATSSIDALIHAIESSLSPLATPFSLLFGHKAIEIIINGYTRIKNEGFEVLPELLEDFMIASNYAGIAFGKAGCGAVHAMSYPLSGKYHVAHGEANYVLLTSVLRKYEQKECSDKYDETITTLKNALGCEKCDVAKKLDELLSIILEKKPMSAYGTTVDDVEAFADSVLTYQQVIMSHNPTVLSKEDVIDIYNDCL